MTIDTLRADRVGSSRALTPTIDDFANTGLRFEHAYAHVPLTLPSHAALMTGAYPTRNGVRDNGTFRLGEASPTLAAALKTIGYRTGAFVGAFVLDARFGLNRGFDLYDDRMAGSPAGPPIPTSFNAPLSSSAPRKWTDRASQSESAIPSAIRSPGSPGSTLYPHEPTASRAVALSYASEHTRRGCNPCRACSFVARLAPPRLARTLVVVGSDTASLWRARRADARPLLHAPHVPLVWGPEA